MVVSTIGSWHIAGMFFISMLPTAPSVTNNKTPFKKEMWNLLWCQMLLILLCAMFAIQSVHNPRISRLTWSWSYHHFHKCMRTLLVFVPLNVPRVSKIANSKIIPAEESRHFPNVQSNSWSLFIIIAANRIFIRCNLFTVFLNALYVYKGIGREMCVGV